MPRLKSALLLRSPTLSYCSAPILSNATVILNHKYNAQLSIKLAIRQCYLKGQFEWDKNWLQMAKFKISNATFWVIFKHCVSKQEKLNRSFLFLPWINASNASLIFSQLKTKQWFCPLTICKQHLFHKEEMQPKQWQSRALESALKNLTLLLKY